MKILFLSSYVDPGSGASILNRLAARLKQDGHQVQILTTSKGFDSDIIKSVRLTQGRNFVNRIVNRIIPNYFSLIIFQLLKEIQIYNPDVINIHWTHGQTIPIQIISQLSKKWPVFWTIHDLWPVTINTFCEDVNGKTFTEQDKTLIQKVLQRIVFNPQILFQYKVWLLSKADIHTISPSKWLLKKVNASPVFRSATNHHVPNGVDCHVFRPLDQSDLRKKYSVDLNCKVILFLSANIINPGKGFYYFAKALERLKASNPQLADNVTTLLVGENSEEANKYLPTKVKNLGSTKDASRLAEYFNLADVFVSASIADNFPSTLLESSASGTPVVAFDVGGVSEIVIDNTTGLLSKSKDISALSSNLERMLIDNELLETLSKNCRNYVVNSFSMDKFVNSYIEIFKNAKLDHNSRRAVA
ncbi:glycosyltransferase [Pseudomonadota bacterium]